MVLRQILIHIFLLLDIQLQESSDNVSFFFNGIAMEMKFSSEALHFILI